MRLLATRLAFLGVIAAAHAGCLEREERIVVRDDGSVRLQLTYRADSEEELYLGDAAPSDDGGWVVDSWIEQDHEGRDIFRLSAEQEFGPTDPLPADYAGPADPHRDVALRFPTLVTIEARADGTYYHFARSYEPRAWAPFAATRSGLEPFDAARFAKMDDAERLASVRSHVDAELARVTLFARDALRDAAPEAPQDGWLRVRSAIRGTSDEADGGRLIDLLLRAEDDPDARRALELEVAAIEQRALDAAQAAMRESGRHTTAHINRFLARYDRHRAMHEVTQDLADERFVIHVTLPGVVVGHNGDQLDGRTVTWTIDGTAMRDRPVELLASARVASR